LARGGAHECIMGTFEADDVYAGWLWWNSLQRHTVAASWNSCCVVMLVLTSLESIKLLSENVPDHLLFGSVVMNPEVLCCPCFCVCLKCEANDWERNCEVCLPCVKISVIHGLSMLISPGFN
jgi:hypothetical protein